MKNSTDNIAKGAIY